VPPLLEQIERALEEKRGLEPQLSAARAERASLEDLVRRTEVWAEGQIRELRDAALQSHARLEAAAAERLVLLEQKEAAADGWRRSQEALARVEAEKRAAEAVAATSERQVDAANARCAKFEAELRELGASARSACTRVEEMAALQGRTVSVERTIDEKVERERTKLANVLAGERERSQSFVEATFLQQQQIVEKQQEALREQRRLYDETHAKQESLARERAAVEQETATAARVAAGAAAAAAAREREALSSSCAPETVTKHTMRASLPSRSAAEIESLLDLQSQIRQASVDVQSSLRHKHVEEVVGAYAETPVPAPSTFAVARSLHDVLAGHR
jgi:chromosome segregation protein